MKQQSRSMPLPNQSRDGCHPRHWVTQGFGAGNLVEEVRETARLAGYSLLDWQVDVIAVWSAFDALGQWVHRRNGASVPRQAGKSVNGIVWVIFLACMMGYKVLWTDHNYSTTCEMLDRFRKILGRRPDDNYGIKAFNRLVTAACSKTAQESYEFKGGGVIAFSTRTKSAGLGYSFDVVVYDEAQELMPEHVQAIMPTTSSGAKHNFQAIYLGTPTRAGSPATNFMQMRTEALGDACGDDLSWVEWGAPEIGDVRDEARLYEVNPSLASGHADINAISAGIRAMLPDDLAAAQEYFGYWLPGTTAASAIDAAAWKACETDAPMAGGKLAFGVKFSPDGAIVAISWARAERGAGSYVELYDVQGASGGTAGVSDMLLRNAAEIAAVCIDGKSGADALIQRLNDGGFPKKAIMQGSSAVVQAAATMLRDEICSKTLTHIASPALDESATRSIKRDIGKNGGWGFGDGPDSVSAPIESVSLALYAARTTKRDPGRVQEASF
ncbi:hypothetical protein [Adlercreutzia sp. ZJ141]|uniref:hypothetical protein n=1 Tax=Adlercreutzia sp. ZJ141 TaxID=2709406 RepID=UPI0013EDD061|nr:hypothetical protein [Adlercreutzia sp. ZJ141]